MTADDVCAAAAAVGACPNISVRSGKKGAACGPTFSRDRTRGPFPTDACLKALNVAWHYNWALEPRFETDVPFVPMVWGRRGVTVPLNADIILGFNEPDHANQGNLSPQEAAALWPQVAEKGRRVGSPAMAGGLLKDNCWLEQFTDAGGHYDFVTLHWYSGCKASKFIQYVQDVYQKYQKPIWVTEFAPQTTSACAAKPGAYSQAQVNQFMLEAVPWMEATPYVERYVWFNAYIGPCALFDAAGNLTETGKMYAAVA